MPEETWADRKVKDLFASNEFVGNVIRYAAILEFEIDCLLAQYFLRKERIDEGLSLLIGSMNFSNKVETLAKVPIRKSVTSFPRAIAGLRRFRRIRNTAAHNWILTFSEAGNLLSSAEYKAMLLNYPEGLKKEVHATRECLWRLARVKEFRRKDGTRVDSTALAMHRILS